MKTPLSTFCKVALLVAPFLCFSGLSAQDLPSVVPPTPNASNFHSYGNTQINHYTGAPNISIPIWNISQGPVNLGINLNYSGGNGIKVAQTASQTGLGWNLNAGGMISRVIRDTADDLPGAYFDSPAIPDIIIDELGAFIDEPTELITTIYDSEPDKYMINALGLNFSFYIDKSLNVMTIPRNKVDITPVFGTSNGSTGNLLGFKVIDEQGLRYEFLQIEEQKNTYPGYTDNRYKTSSWHLSKVTDPNGFNEITFDYDDYSYDYQTEISTNYLGNDDLNITNVSGQETVNHMYVNGKKLSRINFEQGEVVFNYSNLNERTDVSGEYFINSVEIKKDSITLIKGIAFNYGYYANRLKLTQANFYTDNFNQPAYLFEYDESLALPSKLSNAIDHWGYYNGAGNTQNLEPKRIVQYTAGGNTIRTSWGTGNRDPSITYSTLGVLTKVTYPTGGHTEFTYENHDCVSSKFAGPLNSQSYIFDSLEDLEHTVTIPSLDNLPYTAFNINLDKKITDNSQDYYATCSIYYGTDLSTTVGFFNFNPDTFGGASSIPEDTFYTTIAGDYTFIVEFKERYSGTPLVIVPSEDPIGLDWRFSWTTEDTSPTKLMGGIRIKETRDYTSASTLANTTRYTYTNDAGNSSGVMHAVPTYTAYFWDIHDLQGTGDLGKGLTRLISPYYAMNSKGSHVAYSKVRQEQIDHADSLNNGYSEYYYSTNTLSFSDDNYYAVVRDAVGVDTKSYLSNTYNPFPTPAHKDVDFSRGLLEKVIHYDQLGTKLYEKVNTYFHNNLPFQPDYYDDDVRIKGLAITTGVYHTVYYSLSTGFSLLTNTQETSHLNGKTLIKNTTYTYDPMYQGSPITIETTNSNGEQAKIQNTYLFNHTGLTPAEQTLFTTHNSVYAPILSATTLTDLNSIEQQVSSQRTNYKDWGSDLIAVQQIQTAKGVSPLEDRIVFHYYYINGKVKEVSKKDGTHIVYIYGYNESLPVAKIENATYADVEALAEFGVEFSITNGLSATQDTALRTLSGALVTSYQYEPLVGVTSITDANGQSITYHYDNFNRLEFVKDKDGMILNETQYNYKN